MIYTSYYWGQKRGEVISISIYPPKRFDGRHLYFLAPTRDLLNWWKNSHQDKKSEQEYTRIFKEILNDRSDQINHWVSQQLKEDGDKTLCCYEKTGLFCHRHQVGETVIKKLMPNLWGGEIGDNNPKQLTLIEI